MRVDVAVDFDRQLVEGMDRMVASCGYASRSEVMERALLEFLRIRGVDVKNPTGPRGAPGPLLDALKEIDELTRSYLVGSTAISGQEVLDKIEALVVREKARPQPLTVEVVRERLAVIRKHAEERNYELVNHHTLMLYKEVLEDGARAGIYVAEVALEANAIAGVLLR